MATDSRIIGQVLTTFTESNGLMLHTGLSYIAIFGYTQDTNLTLTLNLTLIPNHNRNSYT